jgi:hypothetical protein
LEIRDPFSPVACNGFSIVEVRACAVRLYSIVPNQRLAKSCVVCGRQIEWRKKWERDWEQVRYCSDACRRGKLSEFDRQLERTILQLLAKRSADATICPSEAARAVRPDDWPQWMEHARRAARRLVDQRKVVITQGGKVVDPSTAKGPIRIRKV